jgi:hypothetical protein
MKHFPLTIINCIPHTMQRYDTCGDWYSSSGVNHINVSQMDADKEMETILHELFEKHLCDKDGITAKMVDDWDFSHPELEEPGSHKDCPYREQHLKAMKIGKLAVKLMGYDLKEYDKDYTELADKLSAEWETKNGNLRT